MDRAPSPPIGVRWRLATPAGVPGGVAIFELSAADPGTMDRALATLGLGRIAAGALVVRDLAGVDRGVVARWTPTSVHLMPHGGAAVTRALARELACVLGGPAARGDDLDPRAAYPEATTLLEARMLDALARAASPLAVDLLLAQPARWAAYERAPEAAAAVERRSRVLARLIDPALVVAVGGTNIGKSTLLNTLAGRGVSIVADEPGTTRDHVGVMLDLAGLVVRYVDAPGVRPDAPQVEREAAEMAGELASRCDLLLLCEDATTPAPPGPGEQADAPRVLRVGLRSDLGPARGPVDVRVHAPTGAGVEELVALIRERLVPREVLEDPGPWRFWDDGLAG